MKGMGLSGINGLRMRQKYYLELYFNKVAFMALVGTDTEHQEQHCSCLFLTKSTMGSSETFF